MNKLVFETTKTIQLNVRVEPEILKEIDDIASENKVTRLEAVRALIKFALKESK